MNLHSQKKYRPLLKLKKKKLKSFFFIRQKSLINLPFKINRRIWSDRFYNLINFNTNLNSQPLNRIFKNYQRFFLKGIRRKSEFFYQKILTIQTRIRKIFQRFYNLLTLRKFFSVFRTKSDVRFAKLGILPEEKFITGLDLQIIHIISKLNIFNIKPNLHYQIKSGHIFINNLVVLNPYFLLKIGDSFHVSLFYYLFIYLTRMYTKQFYNKQAFPMLTYFKKNLISKSIYSFNKLITLNSLSLGKSNSNNILFKTKNQYLNKKFIFLRNFKYKFVITKFWAKKFKKIKYKIKLRNKFHKKFKYKTKVVFSFVQKIKNILRVSSKINSNFLKKKKYLKIKYLQYSKKMLNSLQNKIAKTLNIKNVIKQHPSFSNKLKLIKKNNKNILATNQSLTKSAFSLLRKKQYKLSTPLFARKYKTRKPYKLYIRRIFKRSKKNNKLKINALLLYLYNKKQNNYLKKLLKSSKKKNYVNFLCKSNLKKTYKYLEFAKTHFFNIKKKRKKLALRYIAKRRAIYYFKNILRRDLCFSKNLFTYKKINILLKIKNINLIPAFFEFSYKIFLGILYRKPSFSDFYFSRNLLLKKSSRLKLLLKYLLHFFSKLKIVNFLLLKQTQLIKRKIMTFNFIFSRFFSEFQYKLPWF